MHIPRWQSTLLMTAVSALVASAVFLGAVLLYGWFSSPYMPLQGYTKAQIINVNSRVEGMPIFHPGQSILLRIERCNSQDVPVWVVSQHNLEWREQGQVLTVPAAGSFGFLESGCTTKVWVEEIPTPMASGIWRVVGMDETSDGRRVQLQAWDSEPFRVVPP